MAAPFYHVLNLSVPSEGSDALQGRLYDEGCLGLEESRDDSLVVLKAYFDARLPLALFLNELARKIPGLSVRDATTIGLTDISFHPAAFEPFPLVSNCRVVPPPELAGGETKPIANQEIVLMPGLAFGTGRHETTRLVARALWHLMPRPASLLDIGTGSGILAILARKIGIPRVDAVEISEEALENARGNFERNDVPEIRLFRSTDEADGSYRVILGNLLTPTLLHLKSEMVRLSAPRGYLILSGITLDEADEVLDAYRDFHLVHRNDTDDWSCLTLQRPD